MVEGICPYKNTATQFLECLGATGVLEIRIFWGFGRLAVLRNDRSGQIAKFTNKNP